MASGGARNRSGPQPDPSSGRSEARGIKLSALPNEGYSGTVPPFPLVPAVVRAEVRDGPRVAKEVDDEESEARRDREAELWAWAWTTPQAVAWAREPWRWQTVAMWVRTFALCESPDATAADKNSLHRLADQVGLTPAGLRENGWTIAPNEVAEKRATRTRSRPKRQEIPGFSVVV
jgi:hypothetical protein